MASSYGQRSQRIRQQLVQDEQVGDIVGGRLAELGRTLGLTSAGPWQGVRHVFRGVVAGSCGQRWWPLGWCGGLVQSAALRAHPFTSACEVEIIT